MHNKIFLLTEKWKNSSFKSINLKKSEVISIFFSLLTELILTQNVEKYMLISCVIY